MKQKKNSSRRNSESGYTLVEVTVSIGLLGLLFSMIAPLLFATTNSLDVTNATYKGIDQQLVTTTVFAHLAYAAVAPGPTVAGSSVVTPFLAGSLSGTKVVFFSNDTTANGPEEVTASCAITVTKSRCSTPTTFTVVVIPPKVGSCPQSETTPKQCTYLTTTAKTLISQEQVLVTTSKGMIFSYAFQTPSKGVVSVCIQASYPAGCVGSTTTTLSGATCKPSATTTPFANCPAGEITQIAISLSWAAKPNRGAPITFVENRRVVTQWPRTGLFEPSIR